MKKIKVIILAGGTGKRFWPIRFSKSLVPFLGKSLLFHQLELLKRNGFLEVIIVSSPENKSSIDSLEITGLTKHVVIQKSPKGMGDGLLQAEKVVGVGPMVVINGDDVIDETLFQTLSKEILRGKPFVVGKPVTSYIDAGYVRIENNKIVEIVEKPGEGHEPSNVTKLVFDFFPESEKFFTLLRSMTSKKDDVYEKALDTLVRTQEVSYIPFDGFFSPLKYPWHVLSGMEYFLKKITKDYRGKNVQIKSNVVIEGPIHIEDNVKIFEHTKIVGPCYIGKNTIIGNNNIIRNSHIGDGCVTGFNTDITRSYIGANCWFHSNYIGDSVIDSNVSLGAGTVLANLRLDEGDIFSVVDGKKINTKKNKLGVMIGRNVRIGVNTSIMPGVKIGSNSFIGAGISLSHDVADNSFCVGKTTVEIQKNTKNMQKTRDEFRKKI